ncbi:hypothetical protein L873DRAFT_587637 [Choiromyces venosus 120613-1]|uniref:Uncharacterized protein n=1 Tax=Choiromyces venosus 120613-1 TaxID=1336337 RepID=A0A3N4IVF2_9PEZI|nr:hypothetical protein L873DRAFT_587637 [Choiromyces venosus 120613-1]
MYKSDDVREVLSTKRGERQTPQQQDRLSSSKKWRYARELTSKKAKKELLWVVKCRRGHRWGERITTAAAATTAKEGRRGGGGGRGGEESGDGGKGVWSCGEESKGTEKGREKKEEERKEGEGERGGGEREEKKQMGAESESNSSRRHLLLTDSTTGHYHEGREPTIREEANDKERKADALCASFLDQHFLNLL